jgi:hypothetical protein
LLTLLCASFLLRECMAGGTAREGCAMQTRRLR